MVFETLLKWEMPSFYISLKSYHKPHFLEEEKSRHVSMFTFNRLGSGNLSINDESPLQVYKSKGACLGEGRGSRHNHHDVPRRPGRLPLLELDPVLVPAPSQRWRGRSVWGRLPACRGRVTCQSQRGVASHKCPSLLKAGHSGVFSSTTWDPTTIPWIPLESWRSLQQAPRLTGSERCSPSLA